jgi:hypothetical protein
MTRIFADFIVASVAALPSVSSNAHPAPVPNAPDGNFDSVLASVAPTHESPPVTPHHVNAAPVIPMKIAKVPKVTGRGERACGASRLQGAKKVAVESATTTAHPQQPAQPVAAVAQVNAIVAVQAPAAVAAQTSMPVPVADAPATVAQPVGDDAEYANAAPVETAPLMHVPVKDALPTAADVATDGSAIAQNVPVKRTALPAHVIDEIIAAAGRQEDQPATLPSSQSNPASASNIAALISAARATVTVLPSPEPGAAAKPGVKSDAKPAPPAAATGKNASTNAVTDGHAILPQPQDSIDTDAQNEKPVAPDIRTNAQDSHPEPAVASQDKPQQTVSAPATQVQPQTVMNAAPMVVGAPNATARIQAGAAQTATPELQPNISALAVAIAAKSVAGSKTFDIRLDPPELGRVDVHLTVDNDSKVQATVVADHPHTLELLQRGSQDLERALKDAGLSLSNNSLNFSLKGEGRQGDGGGASMARTRSLTSAVVARAEAANASEINFGSASGRLDIRV